MKISDTPWFTILIAPPFFGKIWMNPPPFLFQKFRKLTAPPPAPPPPPIYKGKEVPTRYTLLILAVEMLGSASLAWLFYNTKKTYNHLNAWKKLLYMLAYFSPWNYDLLNTNCFFSFHFYLHSCLKLLVALR